MEKYLLLKNVNIIDVITNTTIKNASIIISNGLIKEVTKQDNTEKTTSNKHIDCSHLWALPGFIDAHVHLFSESEIKYIDDFHWQESYEKALERALRNVRTALQSGITTVRDAGAYNDRNNNLRDFIETNLQQYPFRIISCGTPLTAENGHFLNIGRIWNPNEKISDFIDQSIKSGVNFIKVMNDDPVFNLDQLRIITECSHKVGLHAACHAFTKHSIELAVKAKFDTIEHAFPCSKECAQIIASQGISLCPTFISAKDSVSSESVSSMIIHEFPDCNIDELKKWHRNLNKFLPVAFENGVNIIAGTDAGTYPTDFSSLIKEIFSYVDLGISEMEAIKTATINPARAFNLERLIGSIEKGKSADIVLIGKNPLDNIYSALNDIRGVISRGHFVVNRFLQV